MLSLFVHILFDVVYRYTSCLVEVYVFVYTCGWLNGDVICFCLYDALGLIYHV